ncbi:damage-control phosphatase ARMT1 family protein [Anaerosporobacter sp.]|uniref:damage-control phosphatase ARMT1 family protein n=1 Tax=Anaerosporobacter sp. TaxID=1872529 RepID=UPI00286F399D|nr:ARMT1-like domain-containing protein [Anaerosporobacter sp.]
MQINYKCFPCLVNQIVKITDIITVEDKEQLFHTVFEYLSKVDFNKTNPEIIGSTFDLLKKHTQNNDPYIEIRKYYNTMFQDMLSTFEEHINQSSNPLKQALKYAALANIIDFNPIHNNKLEDIMTHFNNVENQNFVIDHSDILIEGLQSCKSLLYLGDNCGEICLDKLLIKKIKELNPSITIFFGVRGEPVINDSIEEDAYSVGVDEYAKIISNGDNSLGTVLNRVSSDFIKIYQNADIIISKGQANYESLSNEKDKNIFYLLITKCQVIANDIGTDVDSLICKSSLK